MTPAQYTPEEPITSIATALAPAALGIIRVSGKNCIEMVSTVFSRPKALLEAAGNTIVYGWILEKKDTTDAGQKIDEVMCAVYRAPKSFTGEDMVEIFCHGGPSVVTAVQNLMLKIGFRQANRGEYTFRAYINGKTDLTKAEAVKEIIDSHTDAGRSHAAGRLAGNLFTEIDSIKKGIIDTLAAIEVEIEYPEDEETIADSFDRTEIEKAIVRLQDLVDSWKGEKLYQDGARVVLAGRTNAGKSSLFNAILKEERAIVSDIEGTTRDWLESWASINGIPVRLFDTAGLRKTEDVIEAQGVELSKNLASDADVVLYLVDGTVGQTAEDKKFIEECQEPLIVVNTKLDKLGGESLPLRASQESVATPSNGRPTDGGARNAPVCCVSSKTGTGLKELFDEVTKLLTAGVTTERQQAGIGSERQKNAVAEALECVKHAIISADDNYSLDAVVQDLEDALDFLGEVTGDVTPDDVLGSIFANFCVGK
ncbi:MAG: tRNA uridine-5-carboxymethylaminomethyl(34) synthesis GTPase MnmE [Treponema sp.]|nr:tRNA uridine-5-carboxymethylaminomethyl(34) synthesis GTPase MnmE [Treponema sp.]